MIIGKYNCHIAYSGIIFHAKSLPMDYCPDFRRRITTKRETILLARCFVGWLFRWLVVSLIVKLSSGFFKQRDNIIIRYCLPDSSPIYVYNPETSSRVTLASLGTVFQTDYLQVTRPPSNKTIKQPDNKTTKQQNNQTTKQLNNTIRKLPTDRVGQRCANVGRESLSVAYHVPPFLFFQRDKILCVDMSFSM